MSQAMTNGNTVGSDERYCSAQAVRRCMHRTPQHGADERCAVGANEMRSLDLPSQPGRVQRLAAPESHEMGDEISEI